MSLIRWAGPFNFKKLLGFTSFFPGSGGKPCEMLRNAAKILEDSFNCIHILR